MMDYDYDLVVIGAGSGGLAAAKKTSKLGKKVALIEKDELGGTCVNRGCVPTKLMVYAADFGQQQKLASEYGWVNPEGLFDWSDFRQRVEFHIQSIRDSQADKLEGIDVIKGIATFSDSHTITVDDLAITTQYVLLAVGSRPRVPDLRGIDRAITSRDVFHLDMLPDSILIVGGGYIGVEFSQILKVFGCRVTLAESSEHLLDGFDCDVQNRVQHVLEQDGVKILTGSRLEAIEQNPGTLMAAFENGKSVKAQTILCALGRSANIEDLGLQQIGVEIGKNKVKVDDDGRTSVSHIFAVGDCSDKMRLTPVAKAEAETAIDAMFCDHSDPIDYQWIPSAVFMQPEIASVGLSEQEARDRYQEVSIHCETFNPLKYSITSRSIESSIKIIINPETNYIIGLHLVSPRAADIVQALVPALKKGLTKTELDETVGIHPTVGEEIFAL